MPRRELSKKNKYYLPGDVLRAVTSFCLLYPRWEKELNVLTDAARAITYDGDRVQTSGGSDPVSYIALRRIGLEEKKKIIDETITEVAPEIAEYLKDGICYGLTEYQLERKGMPCGKNYYYRKRNEAYWKIAHRM